MKRKNLLLGGLLLLGIGFAAVSTTLYIQGTVNIKADQEGFQNKVVFKSVSLNGTDISASAIIDSGKKISFTTEALKSINETATLKYTIENTSQYAARIGSLTCTPTDTTANTYLTLTATNALNNTLLAKNATSTEDTVTVEMIRSYAGTTGGTGTEEKTYTYECSLPVTAEEVS